MTSQFDHYVHHSGYYNQVDSDDNDDEGWASDEFDPCYESAEEYEQQNFIQRSPNLDTDGYSVHNQSEEEENIYDMPNEGNLDLQLPRKPKRQTANHKNQQQQVSPNFPMPNSMNQSGNDLRQLVEKRQQHRQSQKKMQQNSFANTRNMFEQSKPQASGHPPVPNKKPQMNILSHNNENVSNVVSSGRRPLQHQPNEDSEYEEEDYILPEAEKVPKRIPRVSANQDCIVKNDLPVEIISSKPRNLTGQQFIEQMKLKKLSINNKPQISSKPPSQPKPASISRPISSRPPARPPAQDTYEITDQPPQLPLGRPPVSLPIQDPVQEDYEVAVLPQKSPIGRPQVTLPPQDLNQELYEVANELPVGRRPMPLPFQNPVQETYEVASQPPKLPLGRPPMPLPTQEPVQETYEVASELKLPGSKPPIHPPTQELSQENYEVAGQPLMPLSGRPPVPLPPEDTIQLNEARFQMMRERPLPNPQKTIQDEYEPITCPQASNPMEMTQSQKSFTPVSNHSLSPRNSKIINEYNTVESIQMLGQPQPSPKLPPRQQSPRCVSVPEDNIVDRTLKKGNRQIVRPSTTPPHQISPAGSLKRESRPSAPIVPTGVIPKIHPHSTRRSPDPPQPTTPTIPSRSRPSSLKDKIPSHPLAKYNWFKPEMDRKACEQYLNRSKRNGDFIVRNSSKADACYSISIYHDKSGVRNLQLISKEGKIHLGSSVQGFKSVPDLIDFHQNNSIILNTGGVVTLIRT